jgi:hypothetical protein
MALVPNSVYYLSCCLLKYMTYCFDWNFGILTICCVIQSLKPGRGNIFVCLHYVKMSSESQLASCSAGIGGSLFGGKSAGVRLTTHLLSVPSLWISQLILSLSLYALIACSKKTSLFSVLYQNINNVWCLCLVAHENEGLVIMQDICRDYLHCMHVSIGNDKDRHFQSHTVPSSRKFSHWQDYF